MADFDKELRARLVGKQGRPSPKNAKTTVGRIKAALIDGCRFVRLDDIDLVEEVQMHLASLTATEVPAELQAPADPRGDTQRELSALTGLSLQSVGAIVTRRSLPASGNGKARRFPAETARALFDRRGPGRASGRARRGRTPATSPASAGGS